MKRSTLQCVSLAAASLMLAAGCVAGPQRSPAPTSPLANVSSTTGDQDACAVALGNAPTTTGAAAPGMTITPGTTGAVTPATPGTTGAVTPATPATPATPGTPSTKGTTVGTDITANGVLIGNVALVSLPTTEGVMATPAAPAPTTAPSGATTAAPGGTTTAVPGTTGGATTGSASLDRIRAACTRVVQIRVVTDTADRARLARVAQSIRRGVPVTDLMDELITINRKSTVAWSGATGATGTTAPR